MPDLRQSQRHPSPILEPSIRSTGSTFLHSLPTVEFTAGSQRATVPLIETIDHANLLVQAIYDPERFVPLLLVTSASDTGSPRVDVTALVRSIRGTADVVVVPNAFMAWRLKERLPEAFNTYGGAVRLWWPCADPSDHVDRHPLFFIMREEQSTAAISSIVRALDKFGYGLPGTGGLQPEAVPLHSVPALGSAPPAHDDDLVTRLREDLRRAEERATTAAMEAGALRRQMRSLSDQNARLTERLHGLNVFPDPEEQFRHEVWLAWLDAFAFEDREQFPLRAYSLGEEFLSSVEAVDGVDRSRVVSTCVDVVSNRVWEINGRAAHQHRPTAKAGGPVVRSDGAVAWRCAVQQNAPSARRLHWWEETGGTVDLSRVAVHE
jgi:hypothetical protein